MKKICITLLLVFSCLPAFADEFSEAFEQWDLNRDTMFNGDTENLKIKYKEQFQSLEVMGEAPAQTETASHEETAAPPPAPETETGGNSANEASKGRFSSGMNLDMSLKEASEEAQKRRAGKK